MKKRIRLVKNRVIAAADPGLSGAFAFLSDEDRLVVYDMPIIEIPSGKKSPRTGKVGKKRIFDFSRIKELLLDYNPSYIVVEELQVGGKPGKFKQSAQSISTTSRNYGILLGIVIGVGIPYEEVRASVWQKEFFRGKTGDTKNLSYHTACKLFPDNYHDFIGPRGAKLDGRTDASLICLYAKRRWLGKNKK